ncbi:hypothetical protein B5M47_03650 [candidate division CPR3 bacterium 4484_211]|uniref:pyruvate kinase n=1 Tax=candidate division CPR3 bacterium 4484_211 TaxID=1968527 RepID=A0A1W9NX72_UNCC3|nr:MAG: hypothetical protein B5M47_03650 [candidate division CPR3 bacterium 4484_211]
MNNQPKNTKIIATIGPSSEDLTTLKDLIRAGADIFRFNLKHGTISWHNQIIEKAQKAAQSINKSIQILIDIPSLQLQEGIDLAINTKAAYVALSYVKTAIEITKLKKMVSRAEPPIAVIAKIETKEALDNFSEILQETDAIMVARGDLGRTISIEKVPSVQKEIIAACGKAGKMDIVATEMLLSMTANKIPTMAEVSDVTNAVLEGSDAVMLSEEVATGQYPVEAVKTMVEIVCEAEKH